MNPTMVAERTATGRILVVDDHARARESMTDILTEAGHHVQCCSSAIEATRCLDDHAFDVVITDLKMPGMTGLEFIRSLEKRRTDAQIVMVTAHATITSAVDAMRHGAFDFIEKPFAADQLEQLVDRALSHVERRSSVPPSSDSEPIAMIGSSPAMVRLRQKILQVAPTDETVLITGESGTGKELVARMIHYHSRRRTGALVGVNCPALSPQLMESELFGHDRGAFTSADAPRVGRFELADQGTILLDEVTEIDLNLQSKLLRVLQEKSFERVGSSDCRHVDVRVLAATNRTLSDEVAAGRFREDLYYRLAVVPLVVPPLRHRPEDISQLATFFLQAAAERLEKPPLKLDKDAATLVANYQWPGNVRELANLMTRASVLCTETVIGLDDLEPWLIEPAIPDNEAPAAGHSTQVDCGMSLHEMEKKLIEATLLHFDGHRQKTATALGIGVRTLANKLRSYGYGPRGKPHAA